jgi:hypothetical protein
VAARQVEPLSGLWQVVVLARQLERLPAAAPALFMTSTSGTTVIESRRKRKLAGFADQLILIHL